MADTQTPPVAGQGAPSSPPSRPDTPVLTQSRLTVENYISRAAEITEQLIELHTQLAFDKGSELRVRVETFQQAINTNNVTTAREEATAAASRFTIEVLRSQGEIDGLTLALQHCDRVINHWHVLERSNG